MNIDKVPVIAIDGPSASGKGTVAQHVSERLGFHYLDSGTLYRLVALEAIRAGVDLSDEGALVNIARYLDVSFIDKKIKLGTEDVTCLIRHEVYSNGASQVASCSQLREALLERQRSFCKEPGLVADGRDMGSVVFPNATLKIFLTASVEIRAQRRYKQLIEKGEDVNITTVLKDIEGRDNRDKSRKIAPLKKGIDSIFIDTTLLNIAEVVNEILKKYSEIGAKEV